MLVQANYGRAADCVIAGVPVGREIPDAGPAATAPTGRDELGSIIIVVATDAPLLPHQLKRLARRAALGLARTGGCSGNGSGDIFLAFSTANPRRGRSASRRRRCRCCRTTRIGPALRRHRAGDRGGDRQRAGRGRDDDRGRGTPGRALPHDRLREALKKYNRLAK